MLSHPNTPRDEARALLNCAYDPQRECFVWRGADLAALRLWLLNRLDSATSGVILAAADENVARAVKDQFARVRECGGGQWEAIPGLPAMPKAMGRWRTSLVPLTVVLHRAPLDLTVETHVLGLSADQGRRWYFVPLFHVTQKELNARFPEFAGRFIVPDDPEPDLALFR